jgi:hypothetical protein
MRTLSRNFKYKNIFKSRIAKWVLNLWWRSSNLNKSVFRSRIYPNNTMFLAEWEIKFRRFTLTYQSWCYNFSFRDLLAFYRSIYQKALLRILRNSFGHFRWFQKRWSIRIRIQYKKVNLWKRFYNRAITFSKLNAFIRNKFTRSRYHSYRRWKEW